MSDSSQFLSQGVDYIGFLDSQLRNLRGYSALANEFLQNADDAGASTVVFAFRDDALTIENNAKFSDCGHVEEPECPWKHSKLNRRCDFHSFRRVAGGDKRNREGAIGAFGIGFISAYQITDQPELTSGDRRWIIRPDEPENRRIEQVPDQKSSNTIFRLPWAFDGQSSLRLALHVEPVTNDRLERFQQELKVALPSAILFLRHIDGIELLIDKSAHLSFKRFKDGDQLVVEDGCDTELWQLLHGSFEDEAASLREEFDVQIEKKRKAEVTIAVPANMFAARGVLCAYLPTEHQTGLPFHINADFFPNSDRKRILLESGDYQERWNNAAIRAAASAVAQNLLLLRDLLGPKGLWALLQSIDGVAREAEKKQREQVLAEFWKAASPRLRDIEIVRTTNGQWKKSREVFLLNTTDEEGAIPILESIGISIVDPELRSAYNLLRGTEVGVQVLGLSDLAGALRTAGISQRMDLNVAPEWLRAEENRKELGREIQTLLAQKKTFAARQAIAECAIALSRNGQLAPPAELRRAEEATIEVFSPYGLSSFFLAADNPEGIAELAPVFTAEDAIGALEAALTEAGTCSWEEALKSVIRIVGWFADHRADFRENAALRDRLRKLAIWPSGGKLRPLLGLAVPGNFQDPLRLAQIVDLEVLRNYRDFVIELGTDVLTIDTYATKQVPQAFQGENSLTPDLRRKLLLLLAAHIGELQGNPNVKNALAACKLVECEDGAFRVPGEVYFGAAIVSTTLGDEAHRAVIPRDTFGPAVTNALKWLGVASDPRPRDVLARIQGLVKVKPTETSRRVVQEIFTYLGTIWRDGERGARYGDQLVQLRLLPWLPALGDMERWHRPCDVYAIYSRSLFDTQAQFLDIPVPAQGQSRDLIEFLQIPIEPTTLQVVRHLLTCVDSGREVSRAVYIWLDQKASDEAILRLRGKQCLILPDVGYVRPDQVYWGAHPFGAYRFQLSSDYRVYTSLLKQLEVHESPDSRDATRVLQEIGSLHAPTHKPLSGETLGVVMECWRLLERSLFEGGLADDIIGTLRTLETIPDDRAVLQKPDMMFLDDRPDFASMFDDLIQHNRIVPPLGAWRAMEAAGVRRLSKEVKVALAECEDPVEAKDVREMLNTRRTLIARVLEASRADESADAKLSLLDSLRIERASRLEIIYSLKAFGATRTTPSRPVAAYFDVTAGILYFYSERSTPWAAIARELASAVIPDAAAAKLASGLKEVLSSESFDEARRNLDELGYAPLEADLPTVTESTPVRMGEDIATVDDALAKLGITGAPTPPQGGADKSDQQLPGSGVGPASTSSKGPAGPQRKRSRLRTYVAPEGNQTGEQQEDPVDTQLEKAAVLKVMEYEQNCGRTPEEKPPKYPGLDIESRNEAGVIERYIEVKAVAGDWDPLGVGLTHTQFQRASELGEAYWLYVVDRAEQADFHIYRIQDPARKVDQFFYDEGWAALAEPEQAPAVPAEPGLSGQNEEETIAEAL